MTLDNRRIIGVGLLIYAASATACAQGQEVYSGPQAGEPLPALKVVDVFPTAEGKVYDLTARFNQKPCVLVVIHDLLANKSDEPSLGLAYVLMHYAAERGDKELGRAVVYLTDELTEMRTFLTKVRRALPKKETPLVMSTDGLEGPGEWGLNRNLRMTVVIADRGRVAASFALQQPSASVDLPKILNELVKVTGGDAPKLSDLDFPYYLPAPESN